MQHRKIFVSILLVMFFFVSGCSSNQKEQTLTEQYPNEQIRVYEVFGMDCPGCHGGIEKLVKEIPKVLDAKANWSDKNISIVIEKGATVEDKTIFEAIQRANFTPGKRLQ